MKIYYFIHLVGRDQGNSGIPRVSRNLGKALASMPGVTLVPVRWDEKTSAVVHAETVFLDTMRRHDGPRLVQAGEAGKPIHLDSMAGEWLLVPEVPHLGSHDPAYPSLQFPVLPGYARLHGLKIAAIFHDALPLTHFNEETSFEPVPLSFITYVQGLSVCDVILPVSRASGMGLTSLFGRYGIAPSAERLIEPLLLPEELVGVPRLAYLTSFDQNTAFGAEFCMWGTIFPHKNYIGGMEAFVRLLERRPELDLTLHHIGLVSGGCVERVGRLVRRAKGRIQMHGALSDKDLAGVVQRCRASLFVSRAEGYGLPVAESLWMGLPCITSAIAPMTEIAAGGGALVVDPNDIDSIARGMEQVASDRDTQDQLTRALRQRVFRTWDDYGNQVLERLGAASGTFDAAAAPAYSSHVPAIAAAHMQVMVFDMSVMHAPTEYADCSIPLMVDGVLHYNRIDHGAVTHDVFCFGPYVTMAPGRCTLSFEGRMKGVCQIRLTSNEGNTFHKEVNISDMSAEIDVEITKATEKFEIVFVKTKSLEYFDLESITLTRFF